MLVFFPKRLKLSVFTVLELLKRALLISEAFVLREREARRGSENDTLKVRTPALAPAQSLNMNAPLILPLLLLAFHFQRLFFLCASSR